MASVTDEQKLYANRKYTFTVPVVVTVTTDSDNEVEVTRGVVTDALTCINTQDTVDRELLVLGGVAARVVTLSTR